MKKLIFLTLAATLAISSCDSSTGPVENVYNTQGSLAPYDRSIYAPGVGMIYRESSNSYDKLLYAVINGVRYGHI